MKDRFVRKLFASAAIVAWGALSLSGVAVVPDFRKIEPLARATDEPAVGAAQRNLMGPSRHPDEAVPVFIRLSADDPALPAKVRDLAGDATPIAPRLYTARIPRDAARYISNWPRVSYIEAGKRTRPLLDLSRPAVSADIVHAGTGLPAPFNAGIAGAGTFVGIVDTGVSGSHPDFSSAGPGHKSRIVHSYASPDLASAGLSPSPFVDEHGHGTHVSGIAAGNGLGSLGLYTGAAPEAGPTQGGILVGKTSFYTTDVVDAIGDFAAFAGNRPLSVNLSLGTMAGPHDGSSAFETAVNSLATGAPASKRIVAVAAGNEQNKNEHFQIALPPFGSATAQLTIAPAALTAPSLPMADIWADGADDYAVTATISSGSASVSADAPPNGATHFQVFFNNTSAANVSATITMRRTRNGGSGNVDAYINSVPFNYALSNIFTLNTPAGTTTEPANGDNVVAVGSFTTKTLPGGAASAQSISWFSSLGPTRDGRTKPDLAAPGSVVYSTRSFDAPPGNYALGLAPGNDNYAVLQGTSMAAPHVAGIAALVWESNPALTGAQVRERIRRTAGPPTDGSAAPNNVWGFGKLDALSAVTASVAGITVGFTPTLAAPTVTPGTAVTLRADEKSSGPFGLVPTYSWAVAGGASVDPPSGPVTTFVANVPGNYTVSLTATAGSSTPGQADAVIRVNNVPVASISAPPPDGTVASAIFAGSASDPDVADFGQSITLHWVLVSRPTGSAATLVPVGGTDNATLLPDVAGTYEVGLRADDGLDNSALAVVAFRSGPVATFGGRGGGGGFGCSVARPRATDAGAETATVLFLAAGLAGSLALRRRVRRRRK